MQQRILITAEPILYSEAHYRAIGGLLLLFAPSKKIRPRSFFLQNFSFLKGGFQGRNRQSYYINYYVFCLLLKILINTEQIEFFMLLKLDIGPMVIFLLSLTIRIQSSQMLWMQPQVVTGKYCYWSCGVLNYFAGGRNTTILIESPCGIRRG